MKTLNALLTIKINFLFFSYFDIMSKFRNLRLHQKRISPTSIVVSRSFSLTFPAFGIHNSVHVHGIFWCGQ